MITIIHGDDISNSRNYFLELKHKEKNLVLFDASQITITDLAQNTQGSGLFGNTKMIFIEELLTKSKKTSKEFKEILNFIIRNSKDFFFVLWEPKEILKRDLSDFKGAFLKLFKLPKNIFLFLDNLKPKDSGNLYLFHQALDSGIKIEVILFMIQRQIRLLLCLCHPERNDNGNIDELVRLAPWQIGKLQRQARLFSALELKKIYKKLYEIEIAQKTGVLALSLTQNIDILLLDM